MEAIPWSVYAALEKSLLDWCVQFWSIHTKVAVGILKQVRKKITEVSQELTNSPWQCKD